MSWRRRVLCPVPWSDLTLGDRITIVIAVVLGLIVAVLMVLLVLSLTWLPAPSDVPSGLR